MKFEYTLWILHCCVHAQGQKQSGFPPGPGRDPNKKKQDVSSLCMSQVLDAFTYICMNCLTIGTMQFFIDFSCVTITSDLSNMNGCKATQTKFTVEGVTAHISF